MASKTSFLPSRIHQYILEHSLRDRAVLAELRAETAKDPRAGMQITADQGQFMALLVCAIGARNCIEVGVFTGYSSLAVALALPDDGRIVCRDINEEWTAIARRYWQLGSVEHKIDLRLAPAIETLDFMIDAGEAGQYDFAFIDADKQNYENYYERCLRLLRPGGLLAFDNTLWSGAVADPVDQSPDTHSLRAFNDKLHYDERVMLSLLPLADGLTLALKT